MNHKSSIGIKHKTSSDMNHKSSSSMKYKISNGIIYKLIKSKRKTIGIEIKDDYILVRSPLSASQADIKSVLDKHKTWIDRNTQKLKEKKTLEAAHPVERLTMSQIEELAHRAAEIIPSRVAYYAPLVGTDYNRITIRNQKSRWGSCSAKGNLNFNCLLMLAPHETLDAVVVHELCHRLEMNHSKRFYEHVLRVFPDYHRHNAWLKEHGAELIRRMTG